MKTRLLLLLAAGLLAATFETACAQPVTQRVGVCDPTSFSTAYCLKPQSDGSLNVNASASITGFPTTQSTGTPISVTTGGVTGTLPTGAVVVASNTGTTNNAYCKLGASATTSDQLIAPNSWFAFTVGASTQLTCITSTSTTTVNMVGGSGLPTGAGGGGGGSSSGVAQGSTTSGQVGTLIQGAVTTAAPSYTTAQTSPLSLDTAGNLRVNIVTGSSSGAVAQGSTTSGQTVVPMGCRTLTSAPTDTTAQTNMPSCDPAGALRVNVTSATGVAQGSTTSGQSVSPIGCRTLTSAPTDTTAQTNMPWCRTNGTLAQDLASINGTTVSTGTGAQGSGTPRVTVATDTATIAGSAPGTAGSASANVVTVQGVASMTPVQASLVPTTTNGATAYGLQSAASTNSTNVKNAAGTLLGLNLINTSTTIYYLRMYDSSAAPTCSSATNYSRTWPVPPAAASGGAGGIAASLPVNGVAFASGISFCLTGGPSSTDNTNAATGVFVNIDYK